MFFNASTTDREGSASSMIGNLSHFIDSESEGPKTYNTAGVPKSFDGNISLFKSNMGQYFKRFSKSECCDNAENLLGWLDKSGKGGVTICKKCGYIVDSSIELVPELPVPLNLNEELEEPEQGELESYLGALIDIIENE